MGPVLALPAWVWINGSLGYFTQCIGIHGIIGHMGQISYIIRIFAETGCLFPKISPAVTFVCFLSSFLHSIQLMSIQTPSLLQPYLSPDLQKEMIKEEEKSEILSVEVR